MYIKNKLIRFIVSVLIPISIYFGLASVFANANNDDVFEVMLVFAIYGILIVVPFLIFGPFILYTLFTKKSERSKTSNSIAKVLAIILGAVLLILIDAMTIDVLGALF